MEILEVVEKDKNEYELSFCGHKTTIHSSKEHIDDTIRKRRVAYNMVPDGATIIPRNMIILCKGWLVGGILEDSLCTVYGISSERGIAGYSCSIFWLPTQKELKEILPQRDKLHGDFLVKSKDIYYGL